MASNGEMEIRQTGRGFEAPLNLLSVKDGFNVRQDTSPEAELVRSVKAHGVLNPLHVRNNPERPGHYFLVDGERRLNAAKEAECDTVPIIPEGDLDDAEALVMSLATNDGQKPLTGAEIGAAFQRLKDAKLDEKEIARVMGFETRKVKETLQALADGTEELQKAVTASEKSERIPPRAAARAATLPKGDQKKIVAKMKGKNAKQGVAMVRQVEKKKNIRRRGRKASDFPFVSDARKQTELLEIVLKWILKNMQVTKAEEARITAHAEVIELLKGKRPLTRLYPEYVLEALKEAGKQLPGKGKKVTKKASAKKATKKKASKTKATKATKRKAVKRKATKKKVATKKKAVRKKASPRKKVTKRKKVVRRKKKAPSRGGRK